jgi:pimeloyl-ACP methyl ester carboxylesterase
MQGEAEMFVEVDGRQVFAVDMGAGGVPFVAHSGWIGTWEDWEPQLAAISRERRAVGFDHRGAGRTGGDPAGIGLDTLVGDLFDLLDALEIERCVLGGFSSGNRVVQEAIGRQPERFAGLVLMCPFEAAGPDAGFMGMLQADFEAAVEGFLTVCLTEDESTEHVRTWGRHVLHQADPDQAVALLTELSGPTLATVQPQALDLPVLVVQGKDDPLSPVSYGESLVAALPDARLAVVPGGHLIAQTRPAATAEPMVEFLRTVT